MVFKDIKEQEDVLQIGDTWWIGVVKDGEKLVCKSCKGKEKVMMISHIYMIQNVLLPINVNVEHYSLCNQE